MNTTRIFLEFQNILQVLKGHLTTLPFTVVLTLGIIISVLYSIIFGILLVVAHIAGAYVSVILHPLLPSILSDPPVIIAAGGGCTVCGDSSCGRQRPSGEHQPWVGLEIPKATDQALQDLLNQLLNDFISNWYGNLTKDDSFLWEIRVRLRFLCSVLLRRIIRTDVGELISERLLPLYLRHVDDFVLASGGCRQPSEKLATVVSHLGERLHPAARSRQSELEYLRAISRTLSQICLYKQENHCKAVSIFLVELVAGWLLLTLSDTLCSPHTINSLLWLAVTSPKLQPVSGSGLPKVQFLKSFATRPLAPSNSPLRSDLNTVLTQQRLLFPLMQYLKACGTVNLLQFCLNVEDFNRRLLVPELSASVSAELYREAWDIYSLYLKSDSPDAIPCASVVAPQMHQVLSRGENDIARLQTSTPLFQAFEETFSLLEQVYLPGFYQSEYFFQLLCDNVQPVGNSKVLHKRGHEPLVSKISQKLHRLVTGQNVEEAYLVETACDAGDLDCTDDIDLAGGLEFREMCYWKVTIPETVMEQEPNSRPYPVFIIRVITDTDEAWDVRRKYTDFYTLQSKLLEFHQKLAEELPPRKGLFSPRGSEYLESTRQALELYLQRLIQQPELRYSDLLHCFLRSAAEFTVALRVPLSLTGVLRRSVEPMKLRKDKGRHLEAFLNSLLASVESIKKQDGLEKTPPPPPTKRNITASIFGDNLAGVLKTISSWPPSAPKPIIRLSTFWDCLLYFFWKVLGSRCWLQRLVLVVKSFLGDVASPMIHSLIHKRIQDLLLPRLPYLIGLLQNAIRQPVKVTPEATEALRRQLVDYISRSSKSPIVRILAPSSADGLGSLLETLQYAALNKHLFYLLLDEILRVLVSEFSLPLNSQF